MYLLDLKHLFENENSHSFEPLLPLLPLEFQLLEHRFVRREQNSVRRTEWNVTFVHRIFFRHRSPPASVVFSSVTFCWHQRRRRRKCKNKKLTLTYCAAFSRRPLVSMSSDMKLDENNYELRSLGTVADDNIKFDCLHLDLFLVFLMLHNNWCPYSWGSPWQQLSGGKNIKK